MDDMPDEDAARAGSQQAKPPLDAALLSAFAAEAKRRLGLQAFAAWLTGQGDIELGLLVVTEGSRGKGVGSAAMARLAKLADLYGRRIVLSPALRDDRHGTTSRARLVRFYKRFGFHENKGRRRDFSVSAGMIRDPRPIPSDEPGPPDDAVTPAGPR